MSQTAWYGNNSACLRASYNQTYLDTLTANCSVCLDNGCYFCYDENSNRDSYCYNGDIRNCQLGTPVDACAYYFNEYTALFLILLSIILICCICGGMMALVSCVRSNYNKASRVVPTNAEYCQVRSSRQRVSAQEAYYAEQPHVVETVAIPIVSSETQPVIAHAVVIND